MMETQVSTVDTNAVDILQNSVDVDSAELNRIGASDFIPILVVASSLSESVDKNIARPGEFVLAKTTSLGNEIECVPLAFRLHAALINIDQFGFVESKYVQMGEKTPDEYTAFCTMNPPARHEIQEGADLFLYIPKADSFANIFMKKTLAKCVQPIWSAGKGGRLVKLRTDLQQNRARTRKWYTVPCIGTQRALEISKLEGVTKDVKMNLDLYTKYNTQFRNPPVSAAQTVSEESGTEGIER